MLPHPYAFNLFSHDTKIDPATGYNDEETKVITETRKIFDDPDIRVGVTCIRVPVLRAHAVAVTLECERPIDPDEARALIADAPGVPAGRRSRAQPFSRCRWRRPVKTTSWSAESATTSATRQGRSLSLFVAGDQLLQRRRAQRGADRRIAAAVKGDTTMNTGLGYFGRCMAAEYSLDSKTARLISPVMSV